MPNLSRSSAAIRSWPQVTLFAAISAISSRASAGIRGRPRAFDFHLKTVENLSDASESKYQA
jgi:hypothetical protein